MTCNCGSIRIISVGGKCSDRAWIAYRGKDYNGVVPQCLGVGGGNYLEVEFCVDCGQIQYFKPIPEPTLTALFAKSDEYDCAIEDEDDVDDDYE